MSSSESTNSLTVHLNGTLVVNIRSAKSTPLPLLLETVVERFVEEQNFSIREMENLAGDFTIYVTEKGGFSPTPWWKRKFQLMNRWYTVCASCNKRVATELEPRMFESQCLHCGNASKKWEAKKDAP